MKANWFVGLPVSGLSFAGRVPPPPPGVRLFDSRDLHLTVAFLGPCGDERARRAWSALEWPLPATDATLGDVVPMGDPHRFSALSALLVDGRSEIEAAIGRARVTVCEAAGVPVDPRPAKAHLTLARPQRRATPGDRAAALAWARALDLHGAPIRIDRVSLFTWAEPRIETLFREVESHALAAGP